MTRALCLACITMALGLAVGCGDDDRVPGTRDSGPLPDLDGGGPADAGGPTGCTPGEFYCAGSTHYQCAADGMSREMVTECPAACSPDEGCVACQPGARQCDGDASMVCASDGSGFVTARDCSEAGTTCSGGYCNDACGQAEANKSNIGCEYWPVPLANAGQFSADRYDFRVVIANPNDSVAANVQIYRGGTMTASASVPANGIQDVALPWITGMSDGVAAENYTSLATPNGAYRLVSDTPVIVAQFNPFEYDNGREVPDPNNPFGTVPDYSYTNDASLLLPAHTLTGDYIASSFVPLSSTRDAPGVLFGRTRTSGQTPGYIALVGTTPEPTQVTMAVSAAVAREPSGKFPATPRGGTLSFQLQRGEVVHVVAAAPPDCANGRPGFSRESLCPPGLPSCDAWLETCVEAEFDLTGTRISASGPIEVFGGHACAYVPYNKQACDHLEVQMPPLQTWGRAYVSSPMGHAGMPNLVRVTAATNGTTVAIDPPQGGMSTIELDAGQWREFQAEGAFQVSSSSGAIMVTQYLVGQQATQPAAVSGDPAMTVLVPDEQYRSDYTFVAPTSYNPSTEGQNFIMVVRPPGLAITLDGTALSTDWSTAGGREVGIIPVSGGTHTLQSGSPSETFGVYVFGMGQNTSYAYPAGLNLKEILII